MVEKRNIVKSYNGIVTFKYKNLNTNKFYGLSISRRILESKYGDEILSDKVRDLAKRLKISLKDLEWVGWNSVNW